MGSSPGFTQGQVPTPQQWDGYFAAKADDPGYRPLNSAGDTMSGTLKLPSLTTGAALNLITGVTPTITNNGDFWMTGLGLFYKVNWQIAGPIGAINNGISIGNNNVVSGAV